MILGIKGVWEDSGNETLACQKLKFFLSSGYDQIAISSPVQINQWATSEDPYTMMEGAMDEPVNFDPSTLDMSQILGMVSNTVGNTMDM